MKNCCRNCLHFESGGHCTYWKSTLKEISGFDSDTLFSCTKFKEKKNMKCKLEIIGEFSEWSNTCQECSHYQECMNKCYDSEKADKRPSGENFPTYGVIHLRKVLNTERRQMVEKLLIDNLGKITQDDIDDIEIDIGRYNQECRKDKIKRQYKKRTEPDDNL